MFVSKFTDSVPFTAQRDAAHIKLVTKEEMIEFYNRFIIPSSPTRAKLVVYLMAQASADTVSVDQLSALVKELDLNPEATDATKAKLQEKVQGLGSVEKMVEAIKTHFIKDMGMSESKASGLVEKLAAAQQNKKKEEAGKEGGPAAEGQTNDTPVTGEDGETAANGTKRQVIDDVRAYKAGLLVSVGARPAKDLCEFEDNNAKL